MKNNKQNDILMSGNMNKSLNKIQEKWLKNVFEPYEKNNPILSYPFFLGVSDKYEKEATKKVMIVGQETSGWTKYKTDWSIEESQKWVIDYFRHQLKFYNDKSDEEKLKEEFKRRNSSAFWSFIKQFKSDGIIPCWNNVDKAQKICNGKSTTLTKDIEKELNTPKIDNKTLFQWEVEITKPDLIVFVTGPSYLKTMEYALNLNEGSLLNSKLTYYDNNCLDITDIAKLSVRTFWTYHPACINRMKLGRDEIINKIKNGLKNK